jgi:hypothetical protein
MLLTVPEHTSPTKYSLGMNQTEVDGHVAPLNIGSWEDSKARKHMN